MTGSGVPEEVQDDLITGVADLEWDTQVPTQDVGTLTNPAWNHQYGAFPSPGNTKQYLLFNVRARITTEPLATSRSARPSSTPSTRSRSTKSPAVRCSTSHSIR